MFWEYLEYRGFWFQSPSSNMACHLPLRKTKNVQSHKKKYFPGSFFQGPKFRITKAFHTWHGVLMCFVSVASQVCPKREQKNWGHEDWYQRIRPHWTHGLSGWTFKANRLPTPCDTPVIWDCQILPGHLRPEPLGNQVGRGGCGWHVHWRGIFCLSNEAACLQWMRVVLPVVSTDKMDLEWFGFGG